MIWLVLTLALLLAGAAAAVWLKKRRPRLQKALLAAMAVCTLAVAAGTAVCWNPPPVRSLTPDYAVLLGCGLKDGQATPELERRLTLALTYLEETPEVPLIVTGGDPDGDGVTEAEVMDRWLLDHGADMERVLTEDRARNTLENLQNSKALAERKGLGTDAVFILTSDYHQTRAQFLAHALGQTATGLSCATPWPSRLPAAVRETYSFVKAIVQTAWE